MADDYTFGMEEEYFLVDAETKLVARGMPPEFFEAARKATDDRMRGELLQSQVEVVTRPHVDVASARNELRELRRTVAKVAAEHGLAILAAGTHPTAVWSAAEADCERALRSRHGRAADARPAQHGVRPACACRIARPGRRAST